MTLLLKLAIAVSALSAVVLGDAVLEWGDTDFSTAVTEHDTALVMFYAPW